LASSLPLVKWTGNGMSTPLPQKEKNQAGSDAKSRACGGGFWSGDISTGGGTLETPRRPQNPGGRKRETKQHHSWSNYVRNRPPDVPFPDRKTRPRVHLSVPRIEKGDGVVRIRERQRGVFIRCKNCKEMRGEKPSNHKNLPRRALVVVVKEGPGAPRL